MFYQFACCERLSLNLVVTQECDAGDFAGQVRRELPVVEFAYHHFFVFPDDFFGVGSFFAVPGLVVRGKGCFGIHGDRWYLSVQRNGDTSVFSVCRSGAGAPAGPAAAHKGFMPLVSALQDAAQADGIACTLMKDRLLPLEGPDPGNDKDLPDHWGFLKPFLLGAGGNTAPWRLNGHIRANYGKAYRVAGGLFGSALRVEGPEQQWEPMVRWAAEQYLSGAGKRP